MIKIMKSRRLYFLDMWLGWEGKMHSEFGKGSLLESSHLKNIGRGGKIILRLLEIWNFRDFWP
jgi:hypothetical protein